jgi:hypothetical protein
MAESAGSEKRQNAQHERRESASDSRAQKADVGREPLSRFGEDERRLLADFFILLDQMDRAQARDVRKAA